MFLAGHPSQGCFGLQSHCTPCYFFNQASFYPSDFSFKGADNTATSKLTREKGIWEWMRDAKFEDFGLRNWEQPKRHPRRDPPPVAHKRDA
ncbi:hypothetical protein TNCV_2991581 [Trichonephila clavipes]|uniref:Uncharacterized protein n=1 Tax=Trichonephila clavipes TaxID=2585209 RepID=A0A8X6SDH0_TRICX|nr:hypothetical protein TNCV_2991581 [Trichonephila clavipes]